MSPDGVERTRRLVVAFDGRSTSPMDLADTLRPLADLVWIVDSTDPTLGSMSRLLPRLGTVVDRHGRSVAETVDDLAAAVGVVDGVVAFADAQLSFAAELAAALSLPGNPPATVELLNDKRAQRAALLAAGLPTPGFVRVPGGVDPADVVELVRPLSYPLVLKPVQGESSSNVIRVGDENELLAAFGAPPLADRPVEHAILAEEYLTDPPDPERTIAPYVSVESLVIDGRSVPLAISGRFPLAEPFRETGDFMPHPLETGEAETVVAVAIAAAEALGVRTGALHTEIKLTADGPKVIEVNGRVAGGGINAVYAERNGVSIRWLAASVALGVPIDPPPFVAERSDGPFTYQHFVQPPVSATGLVSIGPTAELIGRDGIGSVTVNRVPGDALDWRAGSQEYVLRVGGTAVDQSALAAVPAMIAGLIEITYASSPLGHDGVRSAS